MRAIFGLVGILVTVGVIAWFLGSGGGLTHTATVIKTGERSREQVNQIAGNDTLSGERAGNSADLAPATTGGRLIGILVTSVAPGGAYERYFGLKKDDTIVAVEYQANRFSVKDLADADMAEAQILEAYSKKGSVVVVRNEQQILLPQAPAKPASPGAAKSDGSPLQKQLDAIPGIPGAR